jgi:hypothetical protein
MTMTMTVTEASTVCMQLGSANCSNTSGAKNMTASTVEELASSRENLTPSSIDKLEFLVAASDLGTLYSPMELANWVPFLKSNATVSIKVVGIAADVSSVSTSFLLAGLALSSERREADGSRVLTATRKDTAVSSMPLKKVMIDLNDDVDDDEDMIDEDGLLDDMVLGAPPAMGAKSATDDCSGRKACDDCSCGRAEQETASSKPTTAPSSSCGKCGMGDAFRCASCPYLGKPAFKAGEQHLVLDLADDF